MKKILSGIAAAAVVFGSALCLTTAASAAEDNGYALSASFDKAEAAKGGNFTMTLTLDENPGLVTLGFRVNYDPNVVIIEKDEDITVFEDFGYNNSFVGTKIHNDEGRVKLLWICGTGESNSTATGDIASIKFTVLPDAAAGSAGISIEPTDIVFVDEEDVERLPVNLDEKYGTDINGYFKVPSDADFDKLIQVVHEHTWDNGTETKAPTCTEKGVKTFTCAECGETKTEAIAALGHDWDNGAVTTQPTCTQKGVKTFTCARCNETKTKEIAALGHDWGEWTDTKEPTDDEEGEKTRECNVCGEKETEAVAKLPPEVTTTVYIGGGFHIPETTAASETAAPTESETTAAAETTSVAADVQTSDVTSNVTADEAADTNANVNVPDNDNTDNGTYDASVSETASAAENIGNAENGDQDKQNRPTGIMLAVIPAAAAAVGVLIFKKRK